MQLHTLARDHAQQRKKRVGRGGKRGKTSGKGTKGQKARAGRKLRPEMRDIIKKLPKLRGYSFQSARPRALEVTTGALGRSFAAGDAVTPHALADRRLIRARGAALPQVKILFRGALDKPLRITGCRVSKGAREQIEKAGGTVV